MTMLTRPMRNKARRTSTETSNPTASDSKVEKREPLVIGEYYNSKEDLMMPVTHTHLKSLAKKLYQWSDTAEGLNILEFYQAVGISKTAFHEYLDKSPELKAAHSYALDAIGTRRDVGAMKKKYDTNAVWRSQYQYGSQYREAMEFAAKLAKRDEDHDAGGTKIVVIEKIVTDPSMQKYIKQDTHEVEKS